MIFILCLEIKENNFEFIKNWILIFQELKKTILDIQENYFDFLKKKLTYSTSNIKLI